MVKNAIGNTINNNKATKFGGLIVRRTKADSYFQPSPT